MFIFLFLDYNIWTSNKSISNKSYYKPIIELVRSGNNRVALGMQFKQFVNKFGLQIARQPLNGLCSSFYVRVYFDVA